MPSNGVEGTTPGEEDHYWGNLKKNIPGLTQNFKNFGYKFIIILVLGILVKS